MNDRQIKLIVPVSVVALSITIIIYIASTLATDRLSGWGSFMAGLGTLIISVGAIYAATVALAEFRENTQVAKAKWLSELFEKLFVDGEFKKMRQKIDFDDIEDIRDLIIRELAWHHISAPEKFTPNERDLLDCFTDYLNFFEFIGVLRSMGRLTDDDVKSLFDYYIRRLVDVDTDQWIRKYLSALGFENLIYLLNISAEYLFVYGTLKQGYSRNKLIWDANLKFLGQGTVRGNLFALPGQDYPAGTLFNSPGRIHGEIYQIPAGTQK